MAKNKIIAPQASKQFQSVELDDAKEMNPAEDLSKHEARLRSHEKRKDLVTLADQFAGHPFYYRNYKFDGADDAFPKSPDCRIVTKYYPRAVEGELFVDEPRNEFELRDAKIKQAFLKAKGIRHVIIQDGMDLQNCAEQLRSA